MTLCITLTTTPSTIPSGKNVISVSNFSWLLNYRGVSETLFTCSRGSCKVWWNSSDVNFTRYSVVTANNNSCLTVTDVQEDEVYVLEVFYNPISPPVSHISFHMTHIGELLVLDHCHVCEYHIPHAIYFIGLPFTSNGVTTTYHAYALPLVHSAVHSYIRVVCMCDCLAVWQHNCLHSK